MWSSNEEIRDRKIIALAETGYLDTEAEKRGNRKCSGVSAMILGIFLTLEIMVAGAMLLNVDVQTINWVSIALIFMVLYSGVVAVLTDE